MVAMREAPMPEQQLECAVNALPSGYGGASPSWRTISCVLLNGGDAGTALVLI